MRLEEKFTNYVRNAVDINVADAGYPIAGQILTATGIATRKQLRELERRGALKAVMLEITGGKHKGQMMKAFYTERQIPKKFIEDQGYTVTEDGTINEQDAVPSED